MHVQLHAGLCTCAAAITHNHTQYWYTCPAKTENQEFENEDSDFSACIESLGSSAHTVFGTNVQKIRVMFSSLCKSDAAMAHIKA